MVNYEALWNKLKKDLLKDATTLAGLAKIGILDDEANICETAARDYGDIAWIMTHMEEEAMKAEPKTMVIDMVCKDDGYVFHSCEMKTKDPTFEQIESAKKSILSDRLYRFAWYIMPDEDRMACRKMNCYDRVEAMKKWKKEAKKHIRWDVHEKGDDDD